MEEEAPTRTAEQQQQHDADFEEFTASAQSLDIHPKGEAEGSITDLKELTMGNSSVSPTSADDTKAEATPEKSQEEEPAENQKPNAYVTPKDFELLKVIGMGAFGKVLQVRSKSTSQIAAMKVISKRLLRRKISYVANIHAERNILSKINQHPFIVTMHCSFQTREKLFIVMDFLAGGELFLRLGREGVFLERTAAFYIAEIILALEHLHSLGILHRDLKPENILLGIDGHLCITDFGLAKDFNEPAWGSGTAESTDKKENSDDERANTICGTQEYMAPEMVARKGYGKAADFWSLGCIAYEMLKGTPPFESKKGSKDLFRKIMNERVRMPDGSSAAACQLLKGLLNRDAQARLGAAKSTMFRVGGVAGLKQCQFFDGLDWQKLYKKEIDPPVDVTVDNENDLRHFHDEFVQMSLPRSVMEMSQDHFQPRRCDSENFRGFSFIQDSYVLPERKESETENYWNNVDADGESLSECASSVFDDDYGTNTTTTDANKGNNNNNLATVDETPQKKKRPPRKKKKKKAEGEEAADTSPKPAEAPAAAADSGPRRVSAKDLEDIMKNINKPSASPENTSSPPGTTAATVTRPIVTTQRQLPQSAPPPLNKPTPAAAPQSWDSVGKAKMKANTVNVVPTTKSSAVGGLNPNSSSFTPVNTYKPAPGSWAGRTTAGVSASTTGTKTYAHPPQLQQSAPGSWAGRATAPDRNYANLQQPAPPLHRGNNYAPTTQKQPRDMGQPQAPPSRSDWRQHSPSWSQPGINRKQLQQQQQPRRPAAPQPPPPKPQLWPALGDDFPPPPGGGKAGGGNGVANSAVKKHPNPSQAASSWGAKGGGTSNGKSAWNTSAKTTTGNAWR